MKKKNERIIILTLLVFSLFMIISSTSAADITLNSTNSKDFKQYIENRTSGDTVTLNSNGGEFILDQSNTNITINKTVTIKSSSTTQNAIINLNANGRAFNITSTGHLTLINITIRNGNFTNNTASQGGAIYNNGRVNLTGCTFTNNTARNGGAIYNNANANLTVTNCTFTNNTVANVTANPGAAIYNNVGSVNLTGCTFTNNTATNGGAIFNNGGSVNLTGCTFTNNMGFMGGAIYNNGSVVLTGCTFTNNTNNTWIDISQNLGGAIYNTGSQGNLTATNCNFTNNTGTTGGAIYSNGRSAVLTGCNFTNPAMNGGAIYISGVGSAVLTGCNFTNNLGGAIYNGIYSNLTVINCTFTNNTALNGGAIYNAGGSANLTNSNFTNNGVIGSRDGGAIYNGINGSLTVTNCTFTNNTARNGGAIYTRCPNVNLTNCNFTNNWVIGSQDGGAIYITGGSVILTNCNFTNNLGGAIYNNGSSVNLTNCNFTNNSATHGGAIYNNGSSVNLTNCNFINNRVTNSQGHGGAIYNTGSQANLTAINCNFTNNTSTILSFGGAISNNANANLTNCTFTNNAAPYGGAINNQANITITGCTFIDNRAIYTGGAIYNAGSSILNVGYSVFYNNTGNYAIYILSGIGYLNDNFYFWVNPDINNIGPLKSNITNNISFLSSFYYLNITNSSVFRINDQLNVKSLLSYVGANRDDSKLPLTNITIRYNGFEIRNYNYKIDTTVQIRVNSTNNNVGFFHGSHSIYQLTFAVLNYTSLEAAIVVSNAFNNQSSYTPASWTTFQSALLAARNVNGLRPAANQSVIDASTNTLNSARNALVLLVPPSSNNYNDVALLINAASGLRSSQYTANSWDVFQKALNAVINMNNNRNAYSKSQIDTLLNIFNSARNGLVRVSGASKVGTVLTVNNLKALFNKTNVITVTARDMNGKLLANKNVGFYLNGKLIATDKTNNAGVARFKYIFKTRNTHQIVAKFTGDTKHTRSNSKLLSLTPKDKTTTNLAKFSAKHKKKATLKATLKNHKNKAIAKKTVKFYANNKYLGKAKTNKKGVAILTKKITAKGSVNFVAKYAGDKNNHDSNHTQKIVVK